MHHMIKGATYVVIILVKLQRRRGGMVKNGQKLQKGRFSLKSLIVEMAPIGMIQWTHNNKKTEISDVLGSIVKKLLFFFNAFRKILKIPKQKTRLMKKRNYKNDAFWAILKKHDRTTIFFGNGLMEGKNGWKLPIGFFLYP